MIAELIFCAFLASSPGSKSPPVPSVTAVNIFAIMDSNLIQKKEMNTDSP